MSKRYAYYLMDSASTVKILESEQLITLPANESQIRPLTKLEPELQKEAWDKVIETAPEGNITAKHVTQIVKEIKVGSLYSS